MTILAAILCNSLVVLPVALVARLLTRRVPAALIHALWLLILVKLVTPPLWRMPMPQVDWQAFSSFEEVVVQDAAVQDVNPGTLMEFPAESQDWSAPLTVPHLDRFTDPSLVPAWPPLEAATTPWSWTDWFTVHNATLLWLAGAAACLLLLLRQSLRFHACLRALDLAPEPWQQEVARLSKRMGLRRAPRVLVTEQRCPPLVWAPGRTVHMVLPWALFRSLSPKERTSLLLHELAHVRRGDHRVRLLELCVRVLHWCNPIAWWAIHELREAEEEACDAWVTTVLPRGVGAYSEALVRTAEFLSHAPRIQPATASGLGRVPALKRRLQMIFRGSQRRTVGPLGRGGVAMAALLTLPLFPVFGQDQEVPPETTDVVESALAGLQDAPPEPDVAVSQNAPPPPRRRGPGGLFGDGPAPAAPDNPFGHAQEADPGEMASQLSRAVKILHELGHHEEASAVLRCANQLAATGSRTAPNGLPGVSAGAGRSGGPVARYVVQTGDSLDSIARNVLGSSRRWPELAEANNLSDPRQLKVGQMLVIPGARVAEAPADRTAGAAGGRRSPPAGLPGATRRDPISAVDPARPTSPGDDRIGRLEKQVQDLSRAVEALTRALGGGPPDAGPTRGPSTPGPGGPTRRDR